MKHENKASMDALFHENKAFMDALFHENKASIDVLFRGKTDTSIAIKNTTSGFSQKKSRWLYE